jgi:hypothetical protein
MVNAFDAGPRRALMFLLLVEDELRLTPLDPAKLLGVRAQPITCR